MIIIIIMVFVICDCSVVDRLRLCNLRFHRDFQTVLQFQPDHISSLACTLRMYNVQWKIFPVK